jgi:hypothetical protein
VFHDDEAVAELHGDLADTTEVGERRGDVADGRKGTSCPALRESLLIAP